MTLFVFLAATLLLTDPVAPAVTQAPATEAVKPTEVKARPGRAVTLKADAGPGKAVQWVQATEADADLIPSADGKTCVFVAPLPGRYLILAYSAAADVPTPATRVLVVVGDLPPPRPPAPPQPPGPKPDADLTTKFKAAFALDAGQLDKKLGTLADLVELYRQAQAIARDPDLETIGMVVGKVRAAGRALAADSLKPVRDVISQELQAAFPTDEILNDEGRGKLVAAFAKINAALAAIQ